MSIPLSRLSCQLSRHTVHNLGAHLSRRPINGSFPRSAQKIIFATWIFLGLFVNAPVQGANVTWTNLLGGSWSSPSNWKPNQVPGPTDKALITAAGNYTVTLSTAVTNSSLTLGNANGAQILVLDGATLNLTGASSIESGAILNLSAGTLSGAGTVTVKGRLDWRNGRVAAKVTSTTTGLIYLTGSGTRNLDGTTLDNAGVLVWDGEGTWALNNGATLLNRGTLDLANDLPLTHTTGLAGRIVNSGSMRKIGGESTTRLEGIDFVNSGNVQLTTGSLLLTAGNHTLTNLSRWTGPNPLINAGGTIDLNGTITNASPLEFQSGVVRGTGALSGSLTWKGGQITGNVTVRQTLDWSSGELKGILTLPVASQLLLAEGAPKRIVGGTLNHSGNAVLDQAIELSNGGGINNVGQLTLSADDVLVYTGGTRPWLLNTGTLRKTSDGLSAFNELELRQKGTLEIAAGVLALTGNTHWITNGARLSGAGQLSVRTGANLLLQGVISNDLPVSLEGGELSGAATLRGPLHWDGGRVSASLTLTGTNLWSGGELTGTLTIPSGAVLQLAAGGTFTLTGGRINNQGTLLMGDEVFICASGAALTNSGLIEFSAPAPFTSTAGVRPTLLNSGTMRKLPGSGALDLSRIDLTNNGVLDVGTGTVNFGSSASSFNTGSRLLGNGRWVIDGGTVNLNGTITSELSLQFVSGSLVGTATLNAGLIWDGGTVTGQFLLNGPAQWSGGVLVGKLTVATNRTLEIGAGTLKRINGGSLTNSGTVLLADTENIQCDNGALIVNRGVFSTGNDEPFRSALGARPTLINLGRFNKTGTTDLTFDSADLRNSGQVDLAGGAVRFVAGNPVFSNGSLFTGTGSNIFSGANLTLTGLITNAVPWYLQTGTLSGTSTFNGTLVWTGGTISGGLTLPPASILEIDGSSRKTLSAATLNQQGVAHLQGTGSLFCDQASQVNNSGLFEVRSEAVIGQLAGAVSTFNNTGIFRKIDAATNNLAGVSFQNRGTIDLLAGGLILAGGTHSCYDGSRVDGAGLFALAGATLSLNGNVAIAPGLQLRSGTLAGNATLTGPLLWTGGIVSAQLTTLSSATWSGGDLTGRLTARGGLEWRSGKVTGALTIPSGASLNLTSNELGRFVSGGYLTNAGTLALSANALLQLDNGAIVINTGLFETAEGATLVYGQGTRPALVNSGVWRKLGSGTLSLNGVDVRNAGVVEIEGALALAGLTCNFDPGSSVRGPGSLRIQGATVNLGNGISLSNRVEFDSGTLSGTTTLQGPVEWKAGTIVGNLSFGAQGTLHLLTTGSKVVDGGTTTLLGTTTIDADAQGQLKNGAIIVNRGTCDSSTDQPFVQSGSIRPILQQRGTLRKRGPGTMDFNAVQLQNSGTLEITQGTLSLSGTTHSLESGSRLLGNGSFRVDGATVTLSSVSATPLFQFISGELKGAGTLSGSLKWVGGKISADLTVSQAVEWQAGVLIGSLTVETNGVLTATGTGSKQISHGQLEVRGVAVLLDGTSLKCDDDGEIRNSGQFILPANFTFSHSVKKNLEFINEGLLALTNGPGIVSADLIFRQTASGRLWLDIGGRGPGTNFTQLRFSQPATLAGGLTTRLVNDFSPVKNDVFEIITAPTISGTFSSVDSNDGRMSATYSLTNLVMACLPPKIVAGPVPTSVVLGQTATLNVNVGGTTPLSYQWLFQGIPLANATNQQLRLTNVITAQSGNYVVSISNVWGEVTSDPAFLTVNIPVTITQQPTNRTVIDGDSTLFQVAAAGTEPFRYQWKFGEANLPGATNSSLLLTNIQAEADGTYSVEVSNIVGPVRSVPADLTVYVRPTLTSSPNDLTVVADSPAALEVRAAGTAPLIYQWFLNGNKITGATKNRLSIDRALPANAGVYTALVTNIAGLVWSRPVRLTVNEPVVIRTQPLSQAVSNGLDATFSVIADGTGPLRYQWRFNGLALSGATNSVCQVPGVSIEDAGAYSVDVGNIVGTKTSASAILTVLVLPSITTQPRSQNVNRGSEATLSVQVAGTAPFGYRWYRNNAPLTGATASSLRLDRIEAAAEGLYTVVVTNIVGSVTSAPAVIALNFAPIILTQPTDVSVIVGSNATFSVFTIGRPEPTYQWRLNGVTIPSETNSTLIITNVQPYHSGNYSVVVANSVPASGPAGPAGPGGAKIETFTVISRAAELEVELPLLPFADAFADASYIFSQTGAGKGFNTNATREVSEPEHDRKKGTKSSIWLRWWSPGNGIATFSTAGSDFDTILAVYAGDTLKKLVTVESDDDSAGFHNSKVSFNAKAGVVYHIAVDGVKGAAGKVVLAWDMLVTSEKLPEIVTAPSDSTGNTNDTITLQVAFDSFEPTQVQWFFQGLAIPGATQNTLRLVHLQPDQVGLYQVRLTAQSGQTVLSRGADVQINGNGYTSVASRNKLGDASDSALFQGIPPFGAGTGGGGQGGMGGGGGMVRGYSGTQIFSTIGADKDLDEPNHCGVSGGASSWFVYQPAANGLLTIDTDGSNFDTVLAVYTGPGTSYATLQSVTCDDDSGANGASSKVVFLATANTIYYIAVDGVAGAQGKVVLNYSLGQPPLITQQPASRSVNPGANVQLFVEADGNPAPKYRWKHNGQVIPGATNSILTLPNFDANAEGTYDAVVENSLGAVTSEPAALYRNGPVRLVNCGKLQDGCFKLRIVGPGGQSYRIDCSPDLQTWVPIATNASPSGIWDYLDMTSTNHPARYYRVMQ